MNPLRIFACAFLICVPLPYSSSAQVTGKVTAQDGSPLPGAIVYAVSGPELETIAKRYQPPRWSVQGGILSPRVYVTQPGASIKLISHDEAGYNVMVGFENGTIQNKAMVPKGETTFVAGKPELFARVSEDLDRLRGYVCVLEYPIFSVTDAAGTFTITNLSSGTYALEAAHPKTGKMRREITVREDRTSTNNFALPGLHRVN